MKNPQVLFEVSWEVCNAISGVHTVIASKVQKMHQYYGNRYFTIGPDLPRITDSATIFREETWDRTILDAIESLNIECRMGKWLIQGEPRTILVNFSKLHQSRDKLLAEYWEKYQLHSLYGGWDYLEPLFFGHAAGLLIEHLYYRNFKDRGERVVVQCHDWSSSAAILHLKQKVREIGTVFTTHGTSLGKALANSNRDIDLSVQLNSDPHLNKLGHEMGVSAKHSLEVVSAHICDCFTTTSSLVAEECLQVLGKKPDLLLLNGLSDDFIVSANAETGMSKKTRARLLDVAEMTTGNQYPSETTDIVISSGRYEYKSKGIDILLDSLALLSMKINSNAKERGTKENGNKRVLAYLLFPATNSGPRRELLDNSGKLKQDKQKFLSTHILHDEMNDPILQKLRSLQLDNSASQSVHVIYVPVLLNGKDSIFKENYYQFLRGTDLSIFPSLYEPWGYTPMESLALGVPTISSDLSGFGRWVMERGAFAESGAQVLRRKNRPYNEVVNSLVERVFEYTELSQKERAVLKKAAMRTGAQTTWQNWSRAYVQSHAIALDRATQKAKAPAQQIQQAPSQPDSAQLSSSTVLGLASHMKTFMVLNKIPASLEKLRTLSKNIWWDWNPDALDLLSSLDPGLWSKLDYNPSVFLDLVNADALEKAVRSVDYQKKLDLVLEKFKKSVSTSKKKPEIAFFCAEYGLTSCLKFYSGGLGILAGDIVKTASDMSLPFCAVGLAYQSGYFKQRINKNGEQENHYERNDFYSLPMQLVSDENGQPVIASIPFPSGPLYFRAWKINAGSVSVYLLDTDFEANRPEERAITNSLYSGDKTHRIRQEILLGVGGHAFLKSLGISPLVYHMNEGHSAFLVLARLADLIQEKQLSFETALEYIRHTSVFTTHTPVPAGHDYFVEEIARPYLSLFEQGLNSDWSSVMGLGKSPTSKPERKEFSVTHLCLRGSIFVNGVSKIHGDVSRKMFQSLFPGFYPAEVPVRSITNGVHISTWLAPEWQSFFANKLGQDWNARLSDEQFWQKVKDLDNQTIWKIHQSLKRGLIEWLKPIVDRTFKQRRESPAALSAALANLDEKRDPLIIGFARRFAPYKRAHLLFHDVKKLEEIIRKAGRPIVFIYAGKAHPNDQNGQGIIKRVLELSRTPELAGKLIFIENYEINVAWHLVSGCDVWLNTPTRPLEASGTSGMKAAINGCLNFSVADGWWAEAFNGLNGWTLDEPSDLSRIDELSLDYQNEYDSSRIYSILQDDLIPKFSDRNAAGVPVQWVKMMKESIATVIPKFSSIRMMEQYHSEFYQQAIKHARELSDEDFKKVQELHEYKERVRKAWKSISFTEVKMDEIEKGKIVIGQPINIRAELSHPDLNSTELSVEAVMGQPEHDGSITAYKSHPLKVQDSNVTNSSIWAGKIRCDLAGPYSIGIRVIPRSCHDEHPLDVFNNLIKWL